MKIDADFLIGLSFIYENMGGVILTKHIYSFFKELTHVPCKINLNQTEVFHLKFNAQTQCGEYDTNCFPNEEAVVSSSQIAINNRFKKFSFKSKQDKFKHRNKRNRFDKQDFLKPC